MKKQSYWLVVAAVGCLSAAITSGRLVRIFDVDDVFKKADVVAIVGDAKTADTKEELNDPGWGRRRRVMTTVRVLVVLKGKVVGETIVISHFRLITPGDFTNGPQLVEFEPDERLGKKNQYLVLLTRGDGDYFEPASGQFDPVYSVRKLCDAVPSRSPTSEPATSQPTNQ